MFITCLINYKELDFPEIRGIIVQFVFELPDIRS